MTTETLTIRVSDQNDDNSVDGKPSSEEKKEWDGITEIKRTRTNCFPLDIIRTPVMVGNYAYEKGGKLPSRRQLPDFPDYSYGKS